MPQRLHVQRGLVFVVSAPSGAGKTTLCGRLVKEYGDFDLSISTTTRPPRRGETQGVEYRFVSVAQFRAKIDAGEFVEWAEVHGNYYGTSRRFLEERLSQGRDVLLDIDVQGGLQLRRHLQESILIFIMPPSLETLQQRLRQRGADAEAEIKRRLEGAKKELACVRQYDYAIINRDITESLAQLRSIILAERQRSSRYCPPPDIAPFVPRAGGS
ncbi:MAG: guanylate kinase [Candidatus Tectomicrobia bacterium]|nr:guanylate kinase [Candidatus Tectomicrobia bacterium]